MLVLETACRIPNTNPWVLAILELLGQLGILCQKYSTGLASKGCEDVHQMNSNTIARRI